MLKEYLKLCEAIGVTQPNLARLLGVEERRTFRWSTGHTRVPAPVTRMLRLLRALKLPPNDVLKMIETPAERRARAEAAEKERQRQKDRDWSGRVR